MSSGLVEFQRMALRKHEEAMNRRNGKISDSPSNNFKNKRKDKKEMKEVVDDFENLADLEPSFEFADVEINDDNIYDAYNSVVNDLNIMIVKYSAVLDRESRLLNDRDVQFSEHEELFDKYEVLMDKYEKVLVDRESLMIKLEKAYDRIEELEDELGY